jgi:hypothetical protein
MCRPPRRGHHSSLAKLGITERWRPSPPPLCCIPCCRTSTCKQHRRADRGANNSKLGQQPWHEHMLVFFMVDHIRNAAREAIARVTSSGNDKPITDRLEARRIALEVGFDCHHVHFTFIPVDCAARQSRASADRGREHRDVSWAAGAFSPLP